MGMVHFLFLKYITKISSIYMFYPIILFLKETLKPNDEKRSSSTSLARI